MQKGLINYQSHEFSAFAKQIISLSGLSAVSKYQSIG
tara:strand:- start:230 stop:340 length:111 start_codon:yes stop_codon:yes gene_type:complete